MFLFSSKKKRLSVSRGTHALSAVCRHLMPKTPVLGNNECDRTRVWQRSVQQTGTPLDVTEISLNRLSYMEVRQRGLYCQRASAVNINVFKMSEVSDINV